MADQIRRFVHSIPINSLAEHWIKDYRLNRRLKRLSKVELDERIADIASNLLILCDDGKYRPRFNVRADRIYAPVRNLDFMHMATDAWEEGRLRGYTNASTPLDSPQLQIAKRLADESWCQRLNWVTESRLSLEVYEQPRMLFRFSKAVWNMDFICSGRTQIFPASRYNDAAAISAVRDDELRLDWYDETLNLQSIEAQDYYCLCLSSEYDYRLFVDFRKDSCVAIKDPAAFSMRLRNAIVRHNNEQPASRIGRLYECPVIYVDPFSLAPPETAGEVQFCKHFRFAYQTEFRFVLTGADTLQLQPFFLELGSLEDIAEMVIAPEGVPLVTTT
jgi:hypothetical protein